MARRPGQRAGLDRRQVLEAARGLLADGGAAALTMRALAAKLAVAPNTLYSHVEDRTALLDALLDDLLGAVDVEEIIGAHGLMLSTYDVLVSAPALLPLFLTRQGARGKNAAQLGQILDGLLNDAGLPDDDVPEARRVLIVHTIGAAAFAVAPSAAGENPPFAAQRARASFSRSLDWLLTGITTR